MPRHTFAVAAAGIGLVGILAACAPPAPPTQPTVSAARTEVVSTAQSAATAAAPTVSSAQTQVAPTVAAAQTQVAPTVSAVNAAVAATATAVAPTAQAVATHVAPTVQAAQTQVTGAVATSVTASPVHVTSVNLNPTDTTVALQNSGSSSMNLRGWTLLLGPSFPVGLSDVSVGAGQTVTLHFSPGTDSASDIYVGYGSGVLSSSLSSGMRVVLVGPRDEVASVYSIS